LPLTESLVEEAALYLGPLPKVISCEIMINNVKNPSEIKI